MSNGKQQTLSSSQFPSVYKCVYNTTRMSATITGTDIRETYFPHVLIGQTLHNVKKRVFRNSPAGRLRGHLPEVAVALAYQYPMAEKPLLLFSLRCQSSR